MTETTGGPTPSEPRPTEPTPTQPSPTDTSATNRQPRPGTATAVRTDELETTRGEMFLAVIFAIFVVIGLIWGYAKLDEPFRPPAIVQLEQAHQALSQTESARFEMQIVLDNARARTTQSREAFRTALDSGRPANETDPLEQAYLEAQTAEEQAQADYDAANRTYTTASQEVQRLEAQNGPELVQQERDARRWIFLTRLAYVIGVLAFAFFALSRWRIRAGRRAPLLYAAVGAATLLAWVMAIDYITDYITWQDLGPLVLSLIGIAFSLAAFLALQRTIVRRIPPRRVRRGECPFCGYPVRLETPGSHQHCEGCGRDVVGACTTCGYARRVGSPFCPTCGHP